MSENTKNISGGSAVNIQAIRDRLKNIARENKRILQEVLTVYALERTIYRISMSRYNGNFTLKGGILLYAMYDKKYPRATADIDLLADKISRDEQNIISVFNEIFNIKAEDGIEYDFKSLSTRQITKLDEYNGINVKITALLGNIRIPVAIDIGFGDVVFPERKRMTFPALLNMPAPEIYAYSTESMLAEKFEAIVSLGYANSRYKDFYDIYVILKHSKFSEEALKTALEQTFKNRKTSFDDIAVFEQSFAESPERQKGWNAFIKKKRAMEPISLSSAVDTIKELFAPIVEKIKNI